MSMYFNRLQPALQNLLPRVVRFFHLRSSCLTHISADVCGGRKSLVKPVMWQNISSCSVLSPEIIMHNDAYIGGCSKNNTKCVVHDNDLGWKNQTSRYILNTKCVMHDDDLGWKNQTSPYILPRHWLYE